MNILRKSPKGERKFLGVCGGIARFLDPEMDPVIIRITFMILILLWPPILLAYFIAAIVLKTHDAPYDREKWIKEYAKRYNVDISNLEDEQIKDEHIEDEEIQSK